MTRVDHRRLDEALRRVERELEVQHTRALSMIGDRIVNDARRTTLFRDRSGALRRSILRGPVVGSKTHLSIDVTAGGARLRYALAIHDGSRPHDIRPSRRKALRFVSGGGFVFTQRVRHPGTAPRPFLTEAVEKNGAFAEQTIASATQLAFVRAGLA